MHGKPYWMNSFKAFAPDLNEFALEKELCWEESFVPGPAEHYLFGACKKEHTGYLELLKYSHFPDVLGLLKFMSETHSTIVDGHEMQAGIHKDGRVSHVFIGAFVHRCRRSAQPCLLNTHIHQRALSAKHLARYIYFRGGA